MSCQAATVFLSCAFFSFSATAGPAEYEREIQREIARIRHERQVAGLPAALPPFQATEAREISRELWQIRRELEKANDPTRNNTGGAVSSMQRLGGGGASGSRAIPPKRSLSVGKLNATYKL